MKWNGRKAFLILAVFSCSFLNSQQNVYAEEKLQEFVKENKLNLGIAYDGDGDRCLAVDENGNIIDGDIIMAIISNSLKQKGKLQKDTLVATVMSNLGMSKFTENNNMNYVQTKVGDRYVLEEMLKNGYNFGGEQSGHIIFLDYNPTGDGILTSLMLIQAMLENNKKISELSEIIKIYPQVLINAKVDSEKKYDYDKNEIVKKEIGELEKEFAKIIDDYFDMFGYKVNKMEIPNLHTRVNWNYLKLISPNVESEDVPEKDMNTYKQMLTNGITFWHNPNTFRDYSQNNSNV